MFVPLSISPVSVVPCAQRGADAASAGGQGRDEFSMRASSVVIWV